MVALPTGKLSVEDYLALDRKAEVLSEYHDGELFPIAAVSWEHSLISLNVGRLLYERLANSPCRTAVSP